MHRILIASDDNAMRCFYLRSLAGADVLLAFVDNGTDLLDEAMTGRYDLILSDANLPGGYGDDVIGYLHAHRVTTPALLVCDQDFQVDDSVADAVLVKPLTSDRLWADIQTFVDAEQPLYARPCGTVDYAMATVCPDSPS